MVHTQNQTECDRGHLMYEDKTKYNESNMLNIIRVKLYTGIYNEGHMLNMIGVSMNMITVTQRI